MQLRRQGRVGAPGVQLVVFAIIMAGACASSPRPSFPDPVPTDSAEAITESSAAGSWRFTHATGRHRFELRSEAFIEAMDTLLADTVTLTALITYQVDHSAGSTSILGTVDSFTVQGSNIPPVSHPVVLPIPFELLTDSTGRIRAIVSPDTSSCGSPAGSLLALARELLITVPPELRVGDHWADTTTATSCRGDIPVTLVSTRSFNVARARTDTGNVLLHIRRESTIGVSGTGTRRIQSTTVTGSGHGWLEQVIDPANGLLLGGHGASTIELTFDAASRRMRFRQRVQQSIRRL